MSNWQRLYETHRDQLDDFWNRRDRPEHRREIRLFGRPMVIASNDEGVLSAADDSARLFSHAPSVQAAPFHVDLLVRESRANPGQPPEDLLSINDYAAHGDWLMIQMGAWGSCTIDLAAGRSMAVLAPELATQPQLVSRGLLNTIFTNLIIGAGYGMLHATGLVDDDRLLLLMAPHGAGKSTTALRLVMAGYKLMTDSMIFISPHSERLQLLGFPVGRIRLRQDVAAAYPQLNPYLSREPVRDEVKYTLDVGLWQPSHLHTQAIVPRTMDLCFLTRSGERETRLWPMTRDEAWVAVMANSLFEDTAERWRRNMEQVERLMAHARLHHLAIGTNVEGIAAALERDGVTR